MKVLGGVGPLAHLLRRVPQVGQVGDGEVRWLDKGDTHIRVYNGRAEIGPVLAVRFFQKRLVTGQIFGGGH